MAAEIRPRSYCPNCEKIKGKKPSRKNLASYPDAVYCLSCGYSEKHNKKQEVKEKATQNTMITTTENTTNSIDEKKVTDLLPGEHRALEERGLTLETCMKYNIRVNTYTGDIGGQRVINKPIKIFPIYHNGKVIKQKIKTRDNTKLMTQRGDTGSMNLFGQNLFSPTKNVPIIVTEGEEDAPAIYQMTDGLPSVSITRGAGGARKELAEHIVYLSGFKSVILAFDNDEAGQKAFDECVVGSPGKPPLFEPGRVKKATFSLKDANDMLLAGKKSEVIKALWNAEIIKPKTLVTMRDIRERILVKPEYGSPWPWQSMTKATYGRRKGELYLLAAATSVGKTEFIKQIISYNLGNGEKIGYFQFEQLPEVSSQRLISDKLNSRIYIPGQPWDVDKINEQIDLYQDDIHFYDNTAGHPTLENIMLNIRFLKNCYNVEFFVLDNLKSLAVNPIIDGKRVPGYEYASHAMGLFSMLCRQLNINIFVINHLSEDKIQKQMYLSSSPKNPKEYLNRTAEDMNKYLNKVGADWETGRCPTIANIFGGGNIKDLTDYILVLARNRMSEDLEEKRTTRVRFLKTRFDSTFEGYEFRLKYNFSTGHLEEDLSYLSNTEISNNSSTHSLE